MSSGADDDARLERYLIEQGAQPEELREAAETGTLGTLALELALRPPGERVPFAEAAERAGVEPAEAAALWKALGFPDPLASPTVLAEGQAETLRILGVMAKTVFDIETASQLARVIGGAAAQIAEAIVDTFRLKVEMPRRSAGEPYPDVVKDYAQIASRFIPALGKLLTDALGTHLISVSGSAWGLDSERATVTRELTVGFADLVGYTANSRRASAASLAAMVSRFETHVGEVVARLGGRVVKLIGDEAMFIVGDPVVGCQLALELNRTLAEDPQLPLTRTALAAGPVVSHHGDYYGDVVNLAARLVKMAEPGEVLVSESVAESDSRSTELRFEPAGPFPLKGYEGAVTAYRLKAPPL